MGQEKRYCVFVIDPDPDTVAMFRAHFRDCGHLVHYCTTAEEAFGMMQVVYPDVCIVRATLPDMDGSVALARIASRFPHAIRMIAGDRRDGERLMRAVAAGIAHRRLCFPWQENDVAAVLERDFSTRRMLRVRRCWRFLERSEIVPVLPEVIVRVEEVMAGDGFGLDELAAVVAADPAVAAMLLRIVNSSAFPKATVIGSVAHAVSYLGVERLREILFYVCAGMAIPPDEACLDLARKVSAHSFACSRLASEVAVTVTPGREKVAATAALLHDLGKLVFLAAGCGSFLDIVAYREAFNVNPSVPETEEFGVTHASLGSSLLLWWHLPMGVVEAVAMHHEPLARLTGTSLCVALANRLLHEAATGVVADDADSLGLPVDGWRRSAALLVAEGTEENPLTN